MIEQDDDIPEYLKSPDYVAPESSPEGGTEFDNWGGFGESKVELEPSDYSMSRTRDEVLGGGVGKTADVIALESEQRRNAPDGSFGELFGAYLETENTVGSAVAQYENIPDAVEESDRIAIENGWNPIQGLMDMGINDKALHHEFADVETPSMLQWKLNNLNRERRNRDIMQRATVGKSLAAGFLAVGIDPVSWAFFGIPFVKGGMMARSTYGASIGASEAAISETLLHSSQQERTLNESMFNIGIASFMGGVLGGAFGKRIENDEFAKELHDKAAKSMADEGDAVHPSTGRSGRLSADKTFEYNRWVDDDFQDDLRAKVNAGDITQKDADKLIADEAAKGSRLFMGALFKPIRRLSPLLDISMSLSHTAREAAEVLMESSFIRNKHFKYLRSADAIDTQIGRIEGQLIMGNEQIVSGAFKEYAGTRSLLKGDIQALGGKNVTLKKFKEMVTESYENNGVYRDQNHPAAKYVDKAAKERMVIMDDFEKLLVEHDILKADNLREVESWHKKIVEYGDELEVRERELEVVTANAERRAAQVSDMESRTAKIAELEKRQAAVKTDKTKKKYQKEIDALRAKNEKVKAAMKGDDTPALNAKQIGAVKRKITNTKKKLKELGDQPPAKSFKAKVPFGSKRYMPRIFRTNVVYKYKNEFEDAVIADWLEQARYHVDNAKSDAKRIKAQEQLDDMLADIERGRVGADSHFDPEKHSSIYRDAEAAWHNITNQHVPALDLDYLGTANMRKKHRTLRVSTKALRNIDIGGGKKIDFIENDIMAITRGHVTAMTPELALKMNNVNIPDIIAKVNNEYRVLWEEAAAAGKHVKENALRAEAKRVTQKIEGVGKVLMNNYANPQNPMSNLNQARQLMSSFNVMRMLGSMTISAVTDLGNLITYVGLRNLAPSFVALAQHKIFRGSAKSKTMQAQARKLGLITELVMASRLNAIAMSDQFGPAMSTASKFMYNRSREFAKATGMNHWNAALKEMVMFSYMDEILGTASKVSKKFTKINDELLAAGKETMSLKQMIDSGMMNRQGLSKRNASKFAAAGIDADDFVNIGGLYAKHGEKVNGVRVPNMEQWMSVTGERLAVADRLVDVLKKQTDMAIVTPSAGDLPLAMRTPVGSMVGQFKSFSFTAVNRLMIPNIQRMGMGDTSALTGMMVQFGLGAAVYGLKMHGMGREDEIDTSWRNLAGEMVDRSGYFGIFADINAISHKLTEGKVSMQGLIGGGDVSRYYSRSVVGDMFGPSYSTLNDMARTFGTVFSDDFNRGDLSAMRRLIPYQNLYWIRRALVNPVENYIADEAGL